MLKSSAVFFAAALVSIPAHAAGFNYKCYSYFMNGHDEKATMDLKVGKTVARAVIHENGMDEPVGGKIDPRYKSKGKVKYLRFGGGLIVQEALANGGERLKDGSLGGFVRFEGEAEGGFFQYKFVCKRAK
jgi:hypothetical protein